MRGDFSAWNKDRSQNFRGTLHQQGRVLLDRDWNAQTEVIGEWQETAGRDAFGPGVAAVPDEVPASFKVTRAEKFTTPSVHIDVSVNKGRVWADGLLVESSQDMVRTATYLNPPPISAADIPAPGKRDAVILETWLEELSPFQVPDLLIEPALGGVDTTERVQTAYRFRLFRMAEGETCDSIIPQLKDDFGAKGKLTATLNAAVSTGGDCPVVESGGYTGFEHRLYRIEIAETNRTAPQAWFKWSQFNGGLVGRGFFDAANRKVVINANENAIVHSGISEFYLEALEFDVNLGHWRVIYGAKAILASDHTLTLPTVADEPTDKFIGSIPASPPPDAPKKFYFFRLWNGIARVGSFTAAPTDLPDLVGIKLKFDPEVAGKYRPSDYWTFPVRVGENPPILINNQPPQGIFHHRVPLAEIHWEVTPAVGRNIEDCRRIFQPLTKQKTCCTYRVGDRISSFGDFTNIQEAIDALPAKGGEVCILPGEYEQNVIIKERRNVILRGCGKRTHIRGANTGPVITVQSSQSIVIESLAVEGPAGAFGIYLNGEAQAAGDARRDFYLKEIKMSDLTVFAKGNSAVRAQNAQFLTLENSEIYIHDQLSSDPAVFLTGDDMVVERSEIRVLPPETPTPNHAAGNVTRGRAFSNDPAQLVRMQGATGGLRIGGGSDRVRIVDNLIISGTGHGISLGSLKAVGPGVQPDTLEKKILGAMAKGWVEKNELPGITLSVDLPLNDILIESNHIINMGRNGISVFAFFSFPGQINPNTGVQKLTSTDVPSLILIKGLTIVGNRIESCVVNNVEIPDHMLSWMAWGGIVLADAEELTIRDNFLTGNGGADFTKPICGIYVIQTEGLEISRNQIMGSMPRFPDVIEGNPKLGVRGGIWIHMAKAFSMRSLQAGPAGTYSISYRSIKGVAAKIQENILTVIFGRSLTLGVGTGHVSVVGNNFTTFNPPPESPVEAFALLRDTNFNLTPKMAFRLTDTLAGNVIIFDRESLVHSLELLSAQLYPSFPYLVDRRLVGVGTAIGIASVLRTGNQAVLGPILGSATDLAAISVPPPPPRVEFEPGFTDTNILFADNQCHQERREEFTGNPVGNSVTSILIATSRDVGFNSNKSACMLEKRDVPGGSVLDFPVINTYIFAGRSSRTSDNRFIETDDLTIHPQPQQPLPRFPLAALTAANWNVTTDNIGTHCIKVEGGTLPKYGRGLLPLYLSRHNLIELEELRGDIANIEPQARPCQRPPIFTWPVHVGTAHQVVGMLEDLQAHSIGENFQLQASKTENYTLQYERNALRYGVDDTRTTEMAMLRDLSAAESQTTFRFYDAASVPIIEVENGWTVDGYVRMPDGGPAPIVTVAAYDQAGNWLEQLSFGCTTVTGYFSIVVENLTGRTPSPVYMRVSKNKRLLAAFNVPQLSPRSGGTDRIEIKLCDPNDRDCGPPDDRTTPLPPDQPLEPPIGGTGTVGTSTGGTGTVGTSTGGTSTGGIGTGGTGTGGTSTGGTSTGGAGTVGTSTGGTSTGGIGTGGIRTGGTITGGAGTVTTAPVIDTSADRIRGAGRVVQAPEQAPDKEKTGEETAAKTTAKAPKKAKEEAVAKPKKQTRAKAAAGAKKTVPKKRGK
jgi:hypothetical protein